MSVTTTCWWTPPRIPDVLRVHGVGADVRDAFGTEDNPTGLKVVVGRKAA